MVATASLVMSTSASAEIIQSWPPPTQDQLDLWRGGSTRNTYIPVTSATSTQRLKSNLIRTMDSFEDFVFHEIDRYEQFDPGVWRENELPIAQFQQNAWEAVRGGWEVFYLPAPKDLPLLTGFGSITVLDPTPNTPGLYQFMTIDFSLWPYQIKVTHYAWYQTDPLLDTRFDDFPYDRSQDSVAIPSPGSGALMIGLGSLLLLRRPQR